MADQYEVRLCSADHDILNRIAKALEEIAGSRTLELTTMMYEKGIISHNDAMDVVKIMDEFFNSRKEG